MLKDYPYADKELRCPEFDKGFSIDACGAGYAQSLSEAEAARGLRAKTPADLAADSIDGPEEELTPFFENLKPCCFKVAADLLRQLMALNTDDLDLLFFMARGGTRTEWAAERGTVKQAAHARYGRLVRKWQDAGAGVV